MNILDHLKKRITIENSDTIESKLYNLANDITKDAGDHLKRVIQVLPEFDMHDASHSMKVVENIEHIIQNNVESLSHYELFLIQCSAFLHDCAMAPSEMEIKTLRLTEGSDNIQLKDSINNDLKPPFSYSEALSCISTKTKLIYNNDYEEIKKSLFPYPSEDKLKEDLAILLREYQEFRNGYAEELKGIKDVEEYEKLNNTIRTDYIRVKHHIRIESLIKNMIIRFESALGQAWGKKLATDLAVVCRAHGENIDYLQELDSDAHYKGIESANLQFVAMMLRLGDIIHFNDDRAPVVLRSTRTFISEYSFLQWAMKDNGVNYTIKEGEISFKAYCDKPLYFFKLHEYIDWIDIEIQNYLRLSNKWEKQYIVDLKEVVNRKDIKNDNEIFEPKMGLRFSLNQRRIIELLMGVGLYKNKYACIRELYQNSLDACRCMLSKLNKEGRSGKGKIIFDIEKHGDNIYLTCCDNGIGMSRYVIENFFLKVGTSYYKSPQFYRKQAEWGGSFTPTSQFGIGVLSSFMIGTKLEITTKMDGEDYISCAIEGPHEYFYYKKVNELDKEKINNSGTLVKILLNSEIKEELTNLPLEKLGLCLLTKYLDIDELIDRDDSQLEIHSILEQYKESFRIYKNHLYSKIEEMIKIIPENINVEILQSDGSKKQLFSKSIIIDYNDQDRLNFNREDIPVINYLNRHNFIDKNLSYSDILNTTETYDIFITGEKGVTFRTLLTLPKTSFLISDFYLLNALSIIDDSGICIDGIIAYIEKEREYDLEYDYYGRSLSSVGLLDFTGSVRPKLSVDRTSIVDYPDNIFEITKQITENLIVKLLETAINHIEKNNLEISSSQYNIIWSYIFHKFSFAILTFIAELSKENFKNIYWNELDNVLTKKDIPIQQLILSDHVCLNNPDIGNMPEFIKSLLLIKIAYAKKIEVKDDVIEIDSFPYQSNNFRSITNVDFYNPIVKVNNWNVSYPQYDLISNRSTFIPERLFNLIQDELDVAIQSDYIKRSYTLSDLAEQDPTFVRHCDNLYVEKGLYHKGDRMGVLGYKRGRIRFDLLHDFQNKSAYILYIFISPKNLSEDEMEILKKFQNEKEFIKGVNEGWSILVTGMDIDNLIIEPGIVNREILVSQLSDSFWENYSDWSFKFTDNTLLSRK
ncbi:MAG: ATP-binding protein [Prevotella sp.]|jgi:hypothetical protein|nr:ATP-binding protein [Prevotella sp.]